MHLLAVEAENESNGIADVCDMAANRDETLSVGVLIQKFDLGTGSVFDFSAVARVLQGADVADRDEHVKRCDGRHLFNFSCNFNFLLFLCNCFVKCSC